MNIRHSCKADEIYKQTAPAVVELRRKLEQLL